MPRRTRRHARRWPRRLAAGAAALLIARSAALGLGAPPLLTPLMVIRTLQGHGIERSLVPLDALGPLPAAVMASEDQRFCEHAGVDWVELRAVLSGRRGGGASTITMQTVKNLYLWPSTGGWADYLRKGLELPAALVLDRAWGKAQVMELYLNTIEFGPGIYGGQAAARHYYGVDADQLSAAQATALAALLPAPLRRSPEPPAPSAVAATRAAAARADCLADR